MRRISGRLSVGLAGFLFSNVALADPSTRAFDWTGAYIGGTAAYGWGTAKWKYFDPQTGVPLQYHNAAETSGGMAGFEFGYNWQINSVVMGFEADAIKGDITGQNDHGNDDCAEFSIGFKCETRTSFLGSLRARLGMTFDRALIFGTAGLAVASQRFTERETEDPSFDTSLDDHRFGGVFGGGLEYALLPSWSLKAEYLYYDLGSFSQSAYANNNLSSDNTKITADVQTFRVSVDYHFGNGQAWK